ncbi:MAG: acyl carrier protein [Dehalococcoidia bacterium]
MLEATDVGREVAAIIAEIKDLDAAAVAEDMPLFSEDGARASLDFDSLDAFELAMALEERFALVATEEVDFQAFKTVRDVVDYVAARQTVAP